MICKYNTGLSVKYGINSALIAGYIDYRLRDKNDDDWVQISQKQLVAVFPFMGEKAVRNAVRRLVNGKILKCKQLNKSNYDHTYSYSLTSYGKSVLQEENYID